MAFARLAPPELGRIVGAYRPSVYEITGFFVLALLLIGVAGGALGWLSLVLQEEKPKIFTNSSGEVYWSIVIILYLCGLPVLAIGLLLLRHGYLLLFKEVLLCEDGLYVAQHGRTWARFWSDIAAIREEIASNGIVSFRTYTLRSPGRPRLTIDASLVRDIVHFGETLRRLATRNAIEWELVERAA